MMLHRWPTVVRPELVMNDGKPNGIEFGRLLLLCRFGIKGLVELTMDT